MLRTKAKWNFLQEATFAQTERFDSKLSSITLELLEQRGITNGESIEKFLTPDLADLNDARLLHNIDMAANRVHQAIAAHENILIFGDYDADGISSTVVMVETLRELGANCTFYIPNRFTEGYGPNEAAFRQAFNDGYTLVITVDNGIAAHHEMKIAQTIGLDVIITDHHEIQEDLPDAYSIVHPKCSPEYPFKELAGVGVALKFAVYLLDYFPKHLLDVAAIGTISDMVPLLNENRIIAHSGLQFISKTPRPGLRALKKLCQINDPVTEEDIGFRIGPRLNAAGRLQDASLAVHLLMTKDDEEATHLAEELDALNTERKQMVENITTEAENMLSSYDENGIIIVAKEGWNEGVLGIVASRLVEKFDRPAIVLSIDSGRNIAKGSARSIPAFDLFHSCMAVRDVFTHFGGHAQAAGMSLPEQHIDTLRQRLNQIIFAELNEDDFTQIIDVNRNLTLSEIDESLIQEIERLAPFGVGNPKPVFQIEEVPVSLKQLGKQRNHLKMEFKQDTYSLSGIGFGMGHLYPFIAQNSPVSIVGELGINEWNGHRNLQMVMKDVGVNSWQLFDWRGSKKRDAQAFTRSYKDVIALLKSTEETKDIQSGSIPLWTYDMDVNTFPNVETLLILDLPDSLEQLQAIVEKVQPVTIYAWYTVENGVYLQPFPSREDFVWLYALVKKRKSLNLKKELQRIMQLKNWKKERIIFMVKVFHELGFVKIKEGVLYSVEQPVKKDLQDSLIYQQRIKRAAIEKMLYYSTYDTLKEWFQNCFEKSGMSKEEDAVHGL